MWNLGPDSTDSLYGPMAGSCEYATDPSRSMKMENILTSYELFK
jgi:hypothetical protein